MYSLLDKNELIPFVPTNGFIDNDLKGYVQCSWANTADSFKARDKCSPEPLQRMVKLFHSFGFACRRVYNCFNAKVIGGTVLKPCRKALMNSIVPF